MEELTAAESRAILEERDVAHLAVVSAGEPYVTPISYVLMGDELLFRTGPGRRLDALTAQPRVCVEVSRVEETGSWESVLVWGDAYRVTEVERRADVVAALAAKYLDATDSLLSLSGAAPMAPEPVVVAVPLDVVTGRSSGRGLSPRTRPGRL